MKSLDKTFLNYACDNLAETNHGLSGNCIVKYSNEYALKYNRNIPHGVYPFEAKNKRTALFENLLSFDAPEQFQIIKDICELSNISNREETKQVLQKLYERCGEYAGKAIIPHLELPKTTNDTLQTLLEDIEHNIKQNTPELILDRLHTFSCKFIREVCATNNIVVINDKGNYLPLHSLIGMLVKQYETYGLFKSDFVATSLKSSISVFEKYNKIRNDYSYAHDNDVLNKVESEFVIKTIANLLCFIDRIEKLRKEATITPESVNFPVPF